MNKTFDDSFTASLKEHYSVAMLVVLISFSMLFASLLLIYVLFRGQNPIWPPMGMNRVSLFYPVVSTIALVASDVFFHLKKPSLKLVGWFFAFLFLGSQILLWRQMDGQGLYVSAGIFTSLIYSLTWIHAAHIIAGLLYLFWAYFPQSQRPQNTQANVERKERRLCRQDNALTFWRFLGIIWIVFFLVLFVW